MVRTTAGPGLLNYAFLLPISPILPLCETKAHGSTLKINLGAVRPLFCPSQDIKKKKKISFLCFVPILVSLIGTLRGVDKPSLLELLEPELLS